MNYRTDNYLIIFIMICHKKQAFYTLLKNAGYLGQIISVDNYGDSDNCFRVIKMRL